MGKSSDSLLRIVAKFRKAQHKPIRNDEGVTELAGVAAPLLGPLPVNAQKLPIEQLRPEGTIERGFPLSGVGDPRSQVGKQGLDLGFSRFFESWLHARSVAVDVVVGFRGEAGWGTDEEL